MVKRKIILLTGSTGFLGKCVFDELSKDYDIIRTFRDKKKIKKNNNNEIHFDLNDLKSYNSILKIKKINYIVAMRQHIGQINLKYKKFFQ